MRNLDAVAHHYGVTIEDRHRASGDALATAAVLRGLLRDASHRGVHTWDELDPFLEPGPARAFVAPPSTSCGVGRTVQPKV